MTGLPATRRRVHTVGVVGLGVMGRPIAENIRRRGFDTLVYARTPRHRQHLEALGCRWATSMPTIWRESDVVVTVLPAGPDVLDILSSKDQVPADEVRPWCVLDMSTTSPVDAGRALEVCRSAGLSFVDAPVSGGEAAAVAGSLSLMIGGD